MAKYIKIRESLYNVDNFIKIEEFKDYQDILNPKTNTDTRKYFTSIALYFSEHSFITVRNLTVKDFEKLLKNK